MASTISELSWMILQFSGIQKRHGCSLPLSIWHNSDIGFEWFWSPTQSYLEVSKNEGSPIIQVRPFKYIETWKNPGDLWVPRTPPNLPPRPTTSPSPGRPSPSSCRFRGESAGPAPRWRRSRRARRRAQATWRGSEGRGPSGGCLSMGSDQWFSCDSRGGWP